MVGTKSRALRATQWIVGTALVLFAGVLNAYETTWKDKRVDSETENNAEFKVDGEFFAGFERVDRQATGQLDAAGTNGGNLQGQNMSQGFSISRAYVNVKGNMIEGPYKGFGFRLTLDGGRNINDENGTASSLTQAGNNAQIAELKFAYLTIPLFDSKILGKSELRFGQSNQPMIDGQAGFSSEGTWGYRIADLSVPEKLQMAVAADRGLAYVQKSDYFGIHLFLSNGEGFRRTNGQAVAVQNNLTTANPIPGGLSSISPLATSMTTAQQTAAVTNLRTISSGIVNGGNPTANYNMTQTDSYAYDISGVVSAKPTGTSKDWVVQLAAPFRFANVIGERTQEYQFCALNPGLSINSSTFECYKGGAGAKKKELWGEEMTVQAKFGPAEVTIGGGHYVLNDRRSNAIRLDTTFLADVTTNPNPGNNVLPFTSVMNIEGNRVGQANSGFITAKVKTPIGKFGALFRQIGGTSSANSAAASGTLNNGSSAANLALAGLPSKSVLQQMAEAWVQQPGIAYGNIGNAWFNTRGTQPIVDLGKGRFVNTEYGLIYEPMDRLKFVLGVNTVLTWNPNGERTKANEMQSGATFTAGTSLNAAANSLIQSQTGAPLTVNDFGGSVLNQRQLYLRAVYQY